jgi:dolichyl-phosphate beta-glucosyltransferase
MADSFPTPMPLASLVIPVHNGAEVLPATLRAVEEFLAQQGPRFEVILVDDHSSEPAASLLRDFVQGHPAVQLLQNGRPRGKGNAVATGLLAGHGKFRLFTDADLAYPIDESLKVLAELERGTDVVTACRVLRESVYLMSPAFFNYLFTRHLMSRIFNRMVRIFVLPGVLDTQAGLKGFTAESVEWIFPRLTIGGFGFDVECLFLARKHGYQIREIPVHFRYDSEPSTMNFIRDILQMLRDLAAIRWNDWRGRYA